MMATGQAARWQRVGVCVLLGLALAAFLGIHNIRRPLLQGPFGYALADPDSYLHWGLVRRALDGEGMRIRWMHEDNAPFGRLNEWTAPMTILGVAVTRGMETVGRLSRERALELGGLWLGPLIGCVALALLAWLGWRAGGWPVAACWLAAWPPLLQVLRVTQFGNTDHHSLHQLTFLAMIGGCLAWRRQPTWAGGVLVGAAGALGFWSGASELLPAWLLVAALAAWETSACGSALPGATGADPAWKAAPTRSATRRFWRAWWISGAALTGLAWLWEFWPRPFHTHLEFLSPWHVSLWLIVGGLLLTLERTAWPVRRRLLACGVATLAALLVAGAIRGFDWANMHVMQDERFQYQMVVTQEFASYGMIGFRAGLQRAWSNYGLLPVALLILSLLSVVGATSLSRPGRANCNQDVTPATSASPRGGWALLVAGAFAALGLYQQRWEAFFVVALVLAVGLALVDWLPRRAWVAVAAMALAGAPVWLTPRALAAEARFLRAEPGFNPTTTTAGLQAVSICLAAATPGGIVLAPWDQSGVLAGLGAARVIGTGYWSNLDGLFAGYELFTTSSTERFRELLAERPADWLLAREAGALAGDIAWAFVALHGRTPARAEIESAVVWQIARHPHAPVLDCAALDQAAPGWKLIYLR